MRIPAQLQPEQVLALIDTREQLPLDLSPLQTGSATLATGDYSVKGLENIVAVERKSEGDLLGCVGRERERFEREVQRLLAYPVRCLVVESTWSAIELGHWRSKVSVNAVQGSLIGWIAKGLPVAMIGTHDRAGQFVSRLLYTAARRRWQECRRLVAEINNQV